VNWKRAGGALALGLLLLSAASAAADSVEDLLFELQLVPLDGQAPPAFTREQLGGGRVSLGELKGRVVLLYFWATW
jgi:hypothetical protein